MAHEHAVPPEPEAPVSGQAAEPLLVLRRGLREGVRIADPREVIVARIGVAALAVGEAIADYLAGRTSSLLQPAGIYSSESAAGWLRVDWFMSGVLRKTN